MQATSNLKINKAYKDVKNSNKRYVVLYGGAGSGKSYYTAQHIILDCLQNPGSHWCVIRKVARTLRNSVYELLTSLIIENDLSDLFQMNKSDMTITCIENGSKIIMSGIDDPEKLKSIANINKFWIEECSELTQKDFTQIDLRLRGKNKYPNQIFITFNPVSNTHWLKTHFFDRINSDALVIKTTYKDNSQIDEEYKAKLEQFKETDSYTYDVYCLGNWGNLSGVVFYNWSVVDSFPDCSDVFYGLDFGFNNPSAFVKIGIRDNEFYVQQLLYKPNLTNADLINELKQFDIKGIIYCDAAEPARIQELQNSGFNAQSANKSVRDGIDFVKAQHLNILDSSQDLINELNEYHWRKDKNDNQLDEPVKFKDHLIDAMRYGIYTHCKSSISVPRITTTGIKHMEGPKNIGISETINNLRMRYRMGI